jgi:isopentenyl phosphate kinase
MVDYLVIKIGGSLFSDKSRDGSLDLAAVDAYAQQAAALAKRHPGRVALITGGGSVGHGAIRTRPGTGPFSLAGLTDAMAGVRWAWTEALLRAGVHALPLQTAAMCTLRSDALQVAPDALRWCLASGVLPVLSGDCILTERGDLRALSSDRVPEIVIAAVPGRVRVVAYTDVPGLLTHQDGAEVVREIDAARPEQAYGRVWGLSEWDSTGGMLGKLTALVTCARLGAECFVMLGDPLRADLDYLFQAAATWSPDSRFTRVAKKESRT